MKPSVSHAVARLLRPLFRLLLRQGISFRTFEEIAKRAYVDVALHGFGLDGKKSSISRVSILSGLTRKEVQRLVEEPLPSDAELDARHNRAARVLSAWVRDADFHDAHGAPRALETQGERSFDTLVKRHSGDMPTRAVLDELLRVDAVYQRLDGRVELQTRAYVPQKGAAEKVGILGADVAYLIDTIDHNLSQVGQPPRFQRKVMYHSMPMAALPAFRALSATQAQALLEKLDRWLAEHDVANPDKTPHAARARVGMGIYYFEESLDSTRHEGKAK
ncbi:hypothetical protein DIC66_15595 [Rhodoferax lacus]|uniref:Uncharacterized protein n=1 Tax=Rhodoferax lacus TaxID=2184758 RepID=A0A3E1R961_9BURK|nr:hypothetical protein DIC66_15595 [Rhodoferax lacus]